ncbi:MAG: diaminopimelate epimerase [Flavobacteriaceae bacterium]|jgi:diaminopimelate epimerase
MMISFYKYQGTGNDFIILDNRDCLFPKNNNSLIASLCDRHFGIGADGLILLEDDENSDFKMVYFNADGNESTMCGNGGRCMVAFAKKLQLFDKTTKFLAIDGIHHAKIEASTVSLQMIDVHEVKVSKKSIFTDTGSPHHVEIVDHLDDFPVVEQARKIINTNYSTEGCNINFVEQLKDETFKVRTYERGVEDETLACGTGATAVAIAMHKMNKSSSNHIKLVVLGGNLEVQFNAHQGRYTNIVLSGPTTFVFEGTIAIS